MTTPAAPLRPRTLIADAVGLMLRHARGQRSAAALSIAGALSFAATIVVSARVIGWITEETVIPAFTPGSAVGTPVATAAAVLLAIAVWRSSSIVLRRGAAAWWQLRTEQALRREVVTHQLGLSLRWYSSRGVGDLLAVSGNDTKKATGLLAPLPFALGSVLLLVGSMALILTIDVGLGLLAGAVMAAVVAIDAVGSWRAFRNMQEVQDAVGRVASVAHESFDGALTIRALGREAEEVARFASVSADHRDALIRLGRSWTAFRSLTDLVPTLGTITLLAAATVLASDGRIRPSDLVTIAYLLSLLVVPTRLIGYLIWDAAQSVAGWRRVRTVLDIVDRPTYGTRTWTSSETSRSGADHPPLALLERVSFSYGDGDAVLRDLDLVLESGRVYALVGPTGSGKSTLARLLCHLWEAEEGRVVIDGIDVRELAPQALVDRVTYVTQEPFLFDRSIRDNITLGDPRIDAGSVATAVRLAQLEDLIADLPEGLDTTVGERGTQLSGGQQQRVGLARALARRPRLLVLDDATSAIDAEVESEILAGLRTAASAGTERPMSIVLVASRPSSISAAEVVIHLDDGRIAAQGSHEQLLGTSPRYAALVEAYAHEAAER